MSGKGGKSSGGSGQNRSNNNKNNSKSSGSAHASHQEPQIVTGWEYHMYSQGSGGDRYQYIGKDEYTGEPEFVDYGPKGGRR